MDFVQWTSGAFVAHVQINVALSAGKRVLNECWPLKGQCFLTRPSSVNAGERSCRRRMSALSCPLRGTRA